MNYQDPNANPTDDPNASPADSADEATQTTGTGAPTEEQGTEKTGEGDEAPVSPNPTEMPIVKDPEAEEAEEGESSDGKASSDEEDTSTVV